VWTIRINGGAIREAFKSTTQMRNLESLEMGLF